MKIINFSIKNFGSYETLSFDDLTLGLTLISGETGSGKSTFLDATTWLLFGETSKDTSVDEVKRWNADSPTEGQITVLTSAGSVFIITRIRGKAQENDLYIQYPEGVTTRGKNISETQQIINEKLGFDSEFYFNTTYFHQFSKAETFFISRSNERRAIFENIVDQTLAIKIADSASNERKNTKKTIEERKRACDRMVGRREQIQSISENTRHARDDWDNKSRKTYEELTKKIEMFEQEKEQKILKLQAAKDHFLSVQNKKIDNTISKLQSLEHKLSHLEGLKCPTCGKSDKDTEKALASQTIETLKNDLVRLSEAENPHIQQIEQIKQQVNTYGDQLDIEKTRVNPFIQEYESIIAQLTLVASQVQIQEKDIQELENYLAKLNLIYDLSFDFRGALLSKVIKNIEVNTNTYLEKHYDSQLKVTFNLVDSDKLEVELQKDGNTCSFKQLSGGQRTMLKLCFWLATKKAIENKAGLQLNILCFDESFNGLDDKLKEQSFGLLQELENTHDSIFVIDHQESFKNHFTTEYKAEIMGDVSKLYRIK